MLCQSFQTFSKCLIATMAEGLYDYMGSVSEADIFFGKLRLNSAQHPIEHNYPGNIHMRCD